MVGRKVRAEDLESLSTLPEKDDHICLIKATPYLETRRGLPR